ncbi:hypothetical protein FCV44_22130 [Vibrio kanaloae]|uniref:SEC-C metal-binding domain-containing protein n=1 Tax=Vibrio kanaloae TaxID=170673 RepID=UPI0010BE83AB|nr:SEC-C metal-binding domain-containing protein [Vibrio kanaloae]TKE88714.1 hypothetical protein FCV44_22130 [Vibrio kanaloae]TKF10105.1 hypothetical protein FCV47_21855 [Vibrio kanaloae]
MSIKLKKHEPPKKSLCLCGSGEKFKHCCFGNHHVMSGRSSSKIIDLINEGELSEALRTTREYITFYTLCHKTNTEPFIKSNNKGVSYLLDVDIKALNELADLLFECYRKLEQVERFENTCEHLRRNILDPRWQKKVTYYQVLSKLDGNWSQSIGEKEVTKFEPIWEETDPEIIQIYLHFMSEKLPLMERVKLYEYLISLLEDKGHILQYRMAIAISYLFVCDEETALQLVSEAMEQYVEEECDSLYSKVIYARCISLRSDLSQNGKLKRLACNKFKEILKCNDLTDLGASEVWREMGSCLFHLAEFDEAISSYQRAYEISGKEAIKVFVALCLTDKSDKEALTVLASVDSLSLDKSEFFDFAVNYAYAATKFESRVAIQSSLELLKLAVCSEPVFEQRRLKSICELNELLVTGKYSKKQYLLDMLKSLSKYLVLQPNVAGIGLNLNKVFEEQKTNKRFKRDS